MSPCLSQYSLDPLPGGLIEGSAAVSNHQSMGKSNDRESRQANQSSGGCCTCAGCIGGKRSGPGIIPVTQHNLLQPSGQTESGLKFDCIKQCELAGIIVA